MLKTRLFSLQRTHKTRSPPNREEESLYSLLTENYCLQFTEESEQKVYLRLQQVDNMDCVLEVAIGLLQEYLSTGVLQRVADLTWRRAVKNTKRKRRFGYTDLSINQCSVDQNLEHIIHDWQKGELLGRGTFGSVYEGFADGGFFFAVKQVSLLDQGKEGKQCIIQLEQEIALLSQFEHKNIVRYYGTKKDGSHLYIFLELVTQGSLWRVYEKYKMRVPQVSGYTRQILHGLKYLHDKNVVHRDIKFANILVHSTGLVKLADFGLAKATKLNDVKSCKGTAFWMAPEVVRSKGYGLAADIWSLGCTVLEMLTRRIPYYGLEYMTALYKIGQGERPVVPDTLRFRVMRKISYFSAYKCTLACAQPLPSSWTTPL